jgi:hypothetical protein
VVVTLPLAVFTVTPGMVTIVVSLFPGPLSSRI